MVGVPLGPGVFVTVAVWVTLAVADTVAVGVTVALAVAVGVALGVAVWVALAVLFGVIVGATGPPSHPPAHVSVLSNRVLLQPADKHRPAHPSELPTPSAQNAAPTQFRHKQHMASAGRGASAARTTLARVKQASMPGPPRTPLPRLDR